MIVPHCIKQQTVSHALDDRRGTGSDVLNEFNCLLFLSSAFHPFRDSSLASAPLARSSYFIVVDFENTEAGH